MFANLEKTSIFNREEGEDFLFEEVSSTVVVGLFGIELDGADSAPNGGVANKGVAEVDGVKEFPDVVAVLLARHVFEVRRRHGTFATFDVLAQSGKKWFRAELGIKL
jgi:hypothetical protein